MSWLDTLLTALSGITANKLRAGLTTLGIIIGVASVIAMLALGNGARVAVESSFRFLGADSIQIATRQKLKNGEFAPVGKNLTFEDGLGMPAAASLVNRAEMSVRGAGKVRRDRNVLDMGIAGTTADALLSLALKNEVQPVNWPDGKPVTPESLVAHGRFFSPAEVLGAAPVCVLGYETAQDLFQGDDPLEQTVLVNRQRCQVIGVLTELEMKDPQARTSNKPNESLYLPISTAIRNLFDKEPPVEITAHVTDERRMDEARVQINRYLRDRHAIAPSGDGSYEDDFSLTTRQDILGAQQEAARTFSLLLAAMAAVSLAVGGIGIMNVMLVSVTESTREIGLRMAVGARRHDIVGQFMLEAILLSACGGVLGTAVGILSIPLAAGLNRGLAVLQPASIPLAFAVALATGLLFGLYPAVRAAQLDPIDALRYE